MKLSAKGGQAKPVAANATRGLNWFYRNTFNGRRRKDRPFFYILIQSSGYKVIEMAGLSHFRFHDIRHTYASMLLHQGESVHYVKE